MGDCQFAPTNRISHVQQEGFFYKEVIMTLNYCNKVGDPENSVYRNMTDDLSEAVKWDHVMCRFRGNRRLIENFISSDCLFGDVDNGETNDPEEWMTIERFKESFKQFSYCLVTSRHHMKEKKTEGSRPRFHVYFPMKEVTCTEEMSELLKALGEKYPFFDQNALDVARFFFGHPDATIISNEGVSITTALESKALIPIRPLRDEVKHIEIGSRNSHLFKLACKWVEALPQDDLSAMIHQANELLPDPLSDKEVDALLHSASRYRSPDDGKVIRNYRKTKRQVVLPDGNYRTLTSIDHELEFTDDMARPVELFYSFVDGSGMKYMFQRQGAEYFITDSKELHYILSKNGYKLDFTSGREITEAKYLVFLRENCQHFERITCVPELNMKPDTLYRGPAIEPEGNGAFRRLLDTMTFETLKDKYRYASGLLSAFMNSSFDGEKPLFAGLAPTSNSGKTYAVRTGCKIVAGRNPIECLGTDKDERQHSGLAVFQNPFVMYDNLQDISREQLLNITLRITDKMIPSHIMYVSHSRIRNGKTYWCTFTSAESVNTDVLNRMVLIRMRDGRDVSPEEKADISDSLIGMEENREKVVADILWHLGKADQSQDVKVKKHPKFPRWSIAMAKMLSPVFPEIDEFDFSLSDEDQEFADDRMLFEEFLEDVLGDKRESFFPISTLVDKWREKNKSFNTTASSLTRRMKAMQKSLLKHRIKYEPKGNQRGWTVTNVAE
jgi:hypothetical protein